ncbi:MAG TPA: hypothetical protein VJM34_10500 [Novosphingobium sp.]|nr:hypothetical protein [Novosphingobium sp.]
MFGKLKRAGLATLIAASAIGLSAPAQARDRWNDGDDDAAIAIGAGIVGLAIGALIADRNDDRYYDSRYYNSRRYVRVQGRPDYYYYYQNNPNRYYRDRYYDRRYRDYDNGRYDNRWRGDYRGGWYGDDRNSWRNDRRHDRRRWRY